MNKAALLENLSRDDKGGTETVRQHDARTQHLNRKRNPGKPCDQPVVTEKQVPGSSRNSAKEPAGLSSSRTLSRKGKLSLRRDGGQRQEKVSSSKAPRDVVMKAILGETVLNQSSDFKEPPNRGLPRGTKGKKGAGNSLSRAKKDHLRTAVSSDSGTSVLDHEQTASGDKRASSSKRNDPGLPHSDDPAGSATATTGSPLKPPRKSPVKGHSVSSKPNPHQGPPSSSLRMAEKESSTDVITCLDREPRQTLPADCTEPLLEPPQSPPPGPSTDHKCPVCEQMIFQGNMQDHVQSCLRKRFANDIKAKNAAGNSDDTSGDEELARMLQRREEEKMREEAQMEEERFFCQICQRELSNMNSTRRAQHINRCIDSLEAVETRPATTRDRPQAQTSTCLICGKGFKTKKSRDAHLKKCARQNRVSPQDLIALVRAQEQAGHQGEVADGAADSDTQGSSRGTDRLGIPAGAGASTGAGSTSSGLVISAREGGSGGTGVQGLTAGAKGRTSDEAGGTDLTGTSAGAASSPGATRIATDPSGAPRDAATTSEGASGPTVLPRVRGGRNATRGKGATRGRGRPKKHAAPAQVQPETLDEETRVVLALSASLAQQPGSACPVKGATTAVDDLPRPTRKLARSKRGGKKEAIKEIPLLIQRTAAEHSRVLGARMADIVLNQENTSAQKTPCLSRSKIAGKYRDLLRKWQSSSSSQLVVGNQRSAASGEGLSPSKSPSNSQSGLLWSLASASSTTDCQKPFYMRKLLPVVTPLKPRSSSRQHGSSPASSTGPGNLRGLTQQKPSLEHSPPSLGASFTSQEGPVTQSLGRTVQILAELAAESASQPYSQSSSRSHLAASGVQPLEQEEEEEAQSQGDEASMIAINPYQLEILHSVSNLINSKEMSDLHLITSDGSIVYAHQFVMKLRCPAFAQVIDDSPTSGDSPIKRLDLQDFDRGTILCVLDFIYAGRVSVTSSGAEEVKALSKRFSLFKLCDLCSRFCKADTNSSPASALEPNPEGQGPSSQMALFPSLNTAKNESNRDDPDFLPDKGLDELIQSLWNSSDDGSDSDDQDDQDVGSKRSPTVKTKRKFSEQVPDTDSDSEAKDSAPDDKDFEEIYEFFSTQRQQNSQRDGLRDQGDASEEKCSDEDAAVDGREAAGDEEEVKEISEESSPNCLRRSLTILEHLQSSCLPQRNSPCREDNGAPSPSESASKNGFVTPERRKHSEISSDDHGNAFSDAIRPCSVNVKKLSRDFQVSPQSKKWPQSTVGDCLEHQANLRTSKAPIEDAWNKPEELPYEGPTCKVIKEPDATLADVGDSIFQSGDENDSDVEMMSITRSCDSDHQHEGEPWGASQSSILQNSSPGVTEGDEENDIRSGDSPLESSPCEGEDIRSRQEVEAVPTQRVTSGFSSTDDQSLPVVNIRSQPSEQQNVNGFVGGRSGSIRGKGSKEGLYSEERFSLPKSPLADEEEVIDLSQDEEQEPQECTVSDSGDEADESNSTDGDEADRDVSWIVPQTPPLAASSAKTSLKKPSPAKEEVKRFKFTFKRRNKPVRSAENVEQTARFKTTSTSVIPNTENSKPKDSDTRNPITETPAAFRAGPGASRDSSTPLVGQNHFTTSHHHCYTSLNLSPVRENSSGDRNPASDLMSKERTGQFGKLSHGKVNDGNPVLGSLVENGMDDPEGSPGQSLSSSPRSTSGRQKRSLGEEGGGSRTPLSCTPVRPTPDCFDADTPELIESISPPPLSPSPPPSPTFIPARNSKQTGAVAPPTQHQSVDDTLEDDGSTAKGSLLMRCKRKLTDERENADLEGPSKRPKSQKTQPASDSILETNFLSPACTTEDDVLLVSNEDEAVSTRNKIESNSGAAGMDGNASWADQLCVGLSPTRESWSCAERESDEDVSLVEEEVSIMASDVSKNASTPRLQINQTPGQDTPQVSPIKRSGNSGLSSSKKPSELPGGSYSPIRRPYTEDEMEAEFESSPQRPTEATPSASLHYVSEEHFAYFGADGGGYMDDFNLCSDEEPVADSEQLGVEEPKPTTLKSRPSSSAEYRGNVSIRAFSSSDEEAPSWRPSSLPASQGSAAGFLSETVVRLREEAEEFGCSESFLSELKAGKVNEEDAWGGVPSSRGVPSNVQSTKTSAQVCKPVPAAAVVSRNQPMTKEQIDKLYHPAAPITPMPSYDDMATPLLKNALKSYGVKPLPKKKARMKLKEIYHFTHQVLEENDSDTDASGPVDGTFKLPSASAKSAATTSDEGASPKRGKGRAKKPTFKCGGSYPSDKPDEARARKTCRPDSALETGGESQSVDGSDESSDSDYSSNRECPEGNLDEDEEDDDDYVEPSQRTAKSIEETIKVYIRTKTDLYEKILCYEPLELDKFHAELKAAGIKYDKKKLRQFLDIHGITCRVVSSATNLQRKKARKPKAKK